MFYCIQLALRLSNFQPFNLALQFNHHLFTTSDQVLFLNLQDVEMFWPVCLDFIASASDICIIMSASITENSFCTYTISWPYLKYDINNTICPLPIVEHWVKVYFEWHNHNIYFHVNTLCYDKTVIEINHT